MAKTFTIQEFFSRFPDDGACLDHLMKVRYGDEFGCPKCGEIGKFRRLRKMPAYTCNCGHHIHPMVGTPFERSRSSLQKWFYAMYLFTTSRHGVPAKELQRQLGVTYKTAWRMGHEIRKYMGEVDGDPPLYGEIEADEVYIGGKSKRREGIAGRSSANKTIVLGMLERGGDVMTSVVPDASAKSLLPHLLRGIVRGSTINTDEWRTYRTLAKYGYTHRVVNHSKKEWVRGSVHTNSIEGFWSLLKRSIRGTHVHVSRKHLPKYLGEFEYRYNMRMFPEVMFERLLRAF